jgi:hypothetical protein
MNDPHVCGCTAALPPKGAEGRGSGHACAGLDGPKGGRVPRPRGQQGHASLGAARQEA